MTIVIILKKKVAKNIKFHMITLVDYTALHVFSFSDRPYRARIIIIVFILLYFI